MEPSNGTEHTLTVLVAEDEVLLRLGIADFLRESGFVVVEASSAGEARAVLSADIAVDAVFSDISMSTPRDGIDLAKWMAEHNRNTPMILASGAPALLAEAKRDCVVVSAFLSKPYDYDDVLARLNGLLKRRAAG
jgi:DNA-binding NtrC family response regulator